MPNTTDLSGFNLPNIAKPDMSYGDPAHPTWRPTYEGIMTQIQKAGDQPTLTSTILPSIAQILSPEGQGVSPYAKQIKEQTAGNVAATQTDMMKRGMTSSDIEMAGMNAARQTGENALATMYGQTANQLAQMIYQAATGDVNNNRELLLTLAQAMGQELTSQRDMDMFQQALKESIEQANQLRGAQGRTALGSGIGAAVGGLAGAFAGPAGFMIGSGVGGAAGGAIAGSRR